MADRRKIVIYGAGDFADIVCELAVICGYSVSGYVCDSVIELASPSQKDIVSIDRIDEVFPANKYCVALGFTGQDLQHTREKKYNLMREKGYELPNLIHPRAVVSGNSEDANIIFEGAIVGYRCCIGHANILWQNCVLPHHNKVGSFNNIAPTVSFSGYSSVGNHCFIGNNATLNNRVHVADDSVVGATAYVNKSLMEASVLVPQRSVILENKSSLEFGL